MSPDKSKELIDIFPDLYKGSDPRSAIALFGFECGDGWFDLLKELLIEIKAICVDNPGITVRVVQVKEKFGGLRFYVDGWNEEVSQLIAEARGKACFACENCGKPSLKQEDENTWEWTVCSEECKAKLRRYE